MWEKLQEPKWTGEEAQAREAEKTTVNPQTTRERPTGPGYERTPHEKKSQTS